MVQINVIKTMTKKKLVDKETKSPEEQTGDKKVFVAAPLPKVNPWKKRSAPAAVGKCGASHSRGKIAFQAGGPSGVNFEQHPVNTPGPPPKQVRSNENKRQKTNPTPAPPVTTSTANATAIANTIPISVSIIKLHHGWLKLF